MPSSDPGHVIQNISWTTTDIENALSLSQLQNVIKTNLPQPVRAEDALPADIERRRPQQAKKRGKDHLMGALLCVKEFTTRPSLFPRR
jgi:hypothetical protein